MKSFKKGQSVRVTGHRASYGNNGIVIAVEHGVCGNGMHPFGRKVGAKEQTCSVLWPNGRKFDYDSEILVEDNRLVRAGARNLCEFKTPPDGEPFMLSWVNKCKPTPEVCIAAAGMSLDDLSHLCIDIVGSFEVTHPKYKRPAKKVWLKAGKPLCLFIAKLCGMKKKDICFDVNDFMTPAQMKDLRIR